MIKSKDLKHSFFTTSHDLSKLFDETNKMSTFMKKLEKQSDIDTLRYKKENYLGDGFEALCEIFLKAHQFDNRIGIKDFEPVLSDDNGVDGIGINIKGERSVLQFKYRSNTESVLTGNNDHLVNLISYGNVNYGVNVISDMKETPRHYVITTATGLHHYTDNEVFKNKVKCIGINHLREMLDNNKHFWDTCREIAYEFSKKV